MEESTYIRTSVTRITVSLKVPTLAELSIHGHCLMSETWSSKGIPRLTSAHLVVSRRRDQKNAVLASSGAHGTLCLIPFLKVAAVCIHTYTVLGCRPNSYNGVHYQDSSFPVLSGSGITRPLATNLGKAHRIPSLHLVLSFPVIACFFPSFSAASPSIF